MNRLFLSAVLVFLLIISGLFAQEEAGSAQSGKLIVRVKGLRNNSGDVKIGLFNNRESFEGKSEKLKGAILPIREGMAIWEIDSLPFGEYAIKLFHDEDGDDKLDRNFIGLPKEQYGFSNNAKGRFGPPKYEKAKFLFRQDEMVVEIDLK